MEKARRDKRKEVQTILNFGENSKRTRRERDNSLNSRAENSPARFHPERSRTWGRERRNERNVFSRLSHRRKSVHERLSDTYSGTGRTDSRDPSHTRGHSHVRERSQMENRSRDTEESYGDTESGKVNPHHLADRKTVPVTKGTGSQRQKAVVADEDNLAEPWTCEDETQNTTKKNIPSCGKVRAVGQCLMVSFVKLYLDWSREGYGSIDLNPESIDGYKGLKVAFLAYFMQQKKYMKDPVEIHNIKQRDGHTIEDFIKRFKVETGHIKGAPECMRISGFMHGVNNPELTKRLNEHVPKTMEEMMTITTAFIRGEAAAASKKKGHLSWKSQDHSKRQATERKSDFRSQPREGRGSSRFTPLIKTPKEILATEAGKFKPPPPMVTQVEKRSSNKFCDFHDDKGHSTDECMQLKKQIEELVLAGKLSHLIKEIKQGRDQIKNGTKEASTKDKSLAIYMIRQWQRMTRQKLTQSFAYGSEITFLPLADSDGTEGPLVIEAEIGGHMIHRIYINGARLLVTIGDVDHCTKAWMDFMIVRSISQYNGIIGRAGIREIQAVPSTAHGMLKFPTDGGIVTIRSTIQIPAECATVITSPKEIPKEAGTSHQNLKVAIHPNFLDQEVVIGGTLSLAGRTELCTLLKKNLDIFAWQPSDMTGVPRSIAEHRLNIREGYSPVRQKKRGQAPERAKAIQAKVQKLIATGIMREVYYHDWLSNPVMVKKHDGSWRMCVDFTDLNKACPQDCYPLPEIDWKIESLCGYPFKCFLDAYKGYHQIQMAESDEEKTAFHTSQGVYCYTKMPFGLKNAGATYQRLVDRAFDSQVGQNIEVYVDDLVIKRHTEAEMLRDVGETFQGIKPCPDKTEAVLQLPSPRTIKEVQSLNGKLASLNRFLSKLAEKSLLLFKTLKRAVTKMECHAWRTPHHIPSKNVGERADTGGLPLSAVLMTKRGTVQTPIYFISRALQGPELNYTPMEKLVLSLVFTAKRPRRYFQAHPIVVITDQPIKQIMSRPDVAGQLQKWSVMLGEHNITYRPRTSVKGQILADFLVEKPDENPPNTPVVATPSEPWTLFMDGSSCVDESAEYEVLISSLRIAAQMGVKNVQVNVDSKLVANQVLGTYVAKEENMIKYLEKVKGLVSGFANFSISQVPRSKNKKADALSKIASTSFAHLSKQVLVEVLQEKSIQEKEVTTVVEEDGPTWMTPIMEYLKDGTLPGDRKEASKLRIKARQYELMEGTLYRRSFLKPWLRCVGPLQASYVIREIHEGSCSMHAGPRSVVAKAMRLGYYWPTMHRDARDMIRACNDCQVHRPVPRNPQQPLTPITAPWPFYKWGIDIAGPFPEGPGKVKFLIVAMDYFTKWIEAKAVATITGNQVKKFVWDNIVCRFGLP
ncbi:reverse transcriptase domain-containing protein [Tanacetum coccineum]